MAKNSQIQWTDHTWNIAVGCTKVDEDCKYCYMYRGSLNNKRYDPKTVRKTKTVFNLPLKIKEPSKIFVSSLTDVFHPECDSFRDEMWDIIRKCPRHTFQILTKRPERIKNHLPEDWGDGWDNVWLGTSVGSQKGFNRIVDLLSIRKVSKTLFLSLEPLYGKLNFRWKYDPKDWEKRIVERKGKRYKVVDQFESLINIDWVIVGGESGNKNGKYRYRPCRMEWIEKIIHDCKSADVPVFVKQLGTYLSKELNLKDRHGGNMEEWPDHLRIREFPRLEVQHG